MLGPISLVYFIVFTVGLGTSRYIGRVTPGSVRVLGGTGVGASTGMILSNGPAYSFMSSAWNGGMGLAGTFFIGCLAFMITIWLVNLYTSEGKSMVR